MLEALRNFRNRFCDLLSPYMAWVRVHTRTEVIATNADSNGRIEGSSLCATPVSRYGLVDGAFLTIVFIDTTQPSMKHHCPSTKHSSTISLHPRISSNSFFFGPSCIFFESYPYLWDLLEEKNEQSMTNIRLANPHKPLWVSLQSVSSGYFSRPYSIDGASRRLFVCASSSLHFLSNPK